MQEIEFSLKEANYYIAETDEPVDEIGRLLGFRSHSGFIGAYKRKTGKTPGQVRRQLSGKTSAEKDVERIRKIIEKYPEKDVTGKSEFTFRYLDAISGEIYGETLTMYMKRCRFRKSRRILASGGKVWKARMVAGYKTASEYSRVFREERGMTPTEYMVRFKMRRAKQLLRNGFPVSCIWKELGYKSELSFYYTFKKLVGMTPRKYAGMFD
jgi:AraC-like DNA-binding protein